MPWLTTSFPHLDARLRPWMIEELRRDLRASRLYLGRYLSPAGRRAWPALLGAALREGDPQALAAALDAPGLVAPVVGPPGGPLRWVPQGAADLLAVGEFNRFYVRGLCRLAVDAGIEAVVLCRYRSPARPRPSSSAEIGRWCPAAVVLERARRPPGPGSFPPAPGSGLSVALPALALAQPWGGQAGAA